MNIVVVGFGFMGMTHTLNILKNPNLHLKAIVDRVPDNILDKLNEQSGNFSTESIEADQLAGVKTYSGLAECLQAEKPDACIIAVHTALHFEMAKMALEAGVNVFVEKPFCLNVEEGEQLIELARSQNKVLMVGHVVRFMPAYETLKRWIDTQEFGQLEFLKLSRFTGIPAWGQWKDRQKDFGSSGGALFDLVIHDIDFAQWVCGVPNTIEAQVLPGKLSHHDYISALWKYNPSNVIVKIDGGNTFHAAYPFQASFSARFENASVFYSSLDPHTIQVTTDTDTTVVSGGDANQGFADELYYFTDCIRSGVRPEKCTPESALESVRICHRHAVE
ncbi:MAG: Gfo/Idh/MocA family oxidoreductase [Bacteroidia bacterium]|nr:Gfo/Idh/MocA family oxidoreductase [Bacteroidia bacterium]